MSLYTRHQILVLLVVLGVAGAGLAVGQWRRLHPDLVDRIERLDRSPSSPVDGDSATPQEAPATPPRVSWPPKVPAGRTQPPLEKKRSASAERIDLNTAPLNELTRLPGVGPVLASRIVDARPYASVDDMRRVRGVGRSKLERLRELVTVAEQ
jgi:DNA uptake protein ComE-like DNA-binding protein